VDIDFDELEELARGRLEPGVYQYFAGAAEDESTMAENRVAWRRRRLRPRVLVDVDAVDTSTTVLGTPLAAPLLVAPMAYQGLLHEDGELALARAGAAAGAPVVVSTMASHSLEDVAAAAPAGPRWFQLYLHEDRAFSLSLCHRARDAGYGALVVTVDMPRLGNRRRARRHGLAMPERVPNFAVEGGPSGTRYASGGFNVSVTAEHISWLARESGLPVLAKGVLRGDDALRALAAGASGVIVSNHGGRQLDGAIASADALADVAAAVAGAAPILVDGGIRSGTDVLRALAMGADAALIGRPVLWALATGGEDGVLAALRALQAEIDLAFRLAGVRSTAEVTADLIATA
jgi:4-hydroxymandelate oxidase